MKIRAAVLEKMGAAPLYAKSKPLAITTLDLAPPGPDEVLIKIAAAGLCHSDLSVINGDRPRPMPMALGHEASGVIEQLGSGVIDLQVGDHVVVVFVPSCGHCSPCAEGRPALCEPGAAANGAGTLLSGARRLARGDEAINHHLGCSVFANYATVSRRSVVMIDPSVAVMDARIYRPHPMGLAAALLDLQLGDRLSYDADRNTLFANFEGMAIRSFDDIDSVRRVFDALCLGLGRKVALIVNYDGFQLDEHLADAYFEMVAELQAKHYTTATRYTTSAFMRMKLGAALPSRHAAAHVFETHSEATEFLRRRPHTVASSTLEGASVAVPVVRA